MKKFELSIKDEKIRGVIASPESEKLMVLVHRFTGDMKGPENIFIKLSKSLESSAYAVLRFSFLGTPPSEGRYEKMTLKSQVVQLKETLKYARKLGYKNIGLLGESMGAAVVLKAYEPNIQTVVFWYPVFDFLDSDFRNYLNPDRREELKRKGFIEDWGFKIGKAFIQSIEKIDIYSDVSNISCPLLFMHGNKDSDVPYQQSEKAYSLSKDNPKKIIIVKGADHCFKNEQNEVIQATSDFLQKNF